MLFSFPQKCFFFIVSLAQSNERKQLASKTKTKTKFVFSLTLNSAEMWAKSAKWPLIRLISWVNQQLEYTWRDWVNERVRESSGRKRESEREIDRAIFCHRWSYWCGFTTAVNYHTLSKKLSLAWAKSFYSTTKLYLASLDRKHKSFKCKSNFIVVSTYSTSMCVCDCVCVFVV